MPATKNWPGMSELTGYDLDNEIEQKIDKYTLYQDKPNV